ncbi:MAG: response regulator transcription factor [Vicingus serpentipes]|nr:response regulator transcription factor [Vicingus serpentipes]
MKEIKVLLADDHLIIRDGIRYMLKGAKNVKVVAEAKNGREVIQYLEKNNGGVDVVLMDINMPELNGIDATEIISKRFKTVNVLALTMHAEESYIMSMIKAGALGYVLKESSKEELFQAIEMIALGKKYFSNDVSVTMINSMMDAGKKENSAEISEREQAVLSLIIEGLTNIEIGKALHISNRTVESHRRNILQKLDVKNTADLVRYAIQNNLIKQ